jgi:non-ribosomal peptide synthetase component F
VYPQLREAIAFLIYTSGSTCSPKKVAIEHRRLLNYLHSIQQILNVPNASFATVSTFAADLGNTVIFPALCGGGCLHILSQDRATDPKALGEYFRQQAIDCRLKIVPSHLKAFLAQTASILPHQRLILGGEARLLGVSRESVGIRARLPYFKSLGTNTYS